MKKIDEVYIRLLIRCDLKCPFCYFEGMNYISDDVSLERIKEILSKIKEEYIIDDLTSFEVSGGEPLIYENLDKVFYYLKDHYSGPIIIKTNLNKINNLFPILQIFEKEKNRITIKTDCHFEIKNEEEKENYLKNVSRIQNMGFKIQVVYTIAAGSFFNENIIEYNINKLKEYNLKYKIKPVVYKQSIENSSVENYTNEQKKFLSSIRENIFHENIVKNKLYIHSSDEYYYKTTG